MNYIKCPNCGSQFYPDEMEQIHCDHCGIIIQDQSYSSDKEWRIFRMSETSQKSRTSPVLVTPFSSKEYLSTEIDFSSKKDAVLQKWQNRFKRPSREKNYHYAFTELNRLTQILELPQYLKEETIEQYKICLQQNLVRGRSIEGILVSIIYLCCKKFKFPKILREISLKNKTFKKRNRKSFSVSFKKIKFFSG